MIQATTSAPFEHRAYPKIPRLPPDTVGGGPVWVATEKIHGAQLVVASDGEQVSFGKRKAWLSPDEPFFGWQSIRRELGEGAVALHRALRPDGTLYLYGELFGGGYPHAAVEALPGLTAVQTGIWYAPTLAFAAFDLLVDRDGVPTFIGHTELEALARPAGLHAVPTLARGPRAEVSRQPVRYPTRVPAMLGLPALSNNVAEGFVLKPDAELPAASRPLVKYKIPEFDEARFDESRPFDDGLHLSVEAMQAWAASMINAPRLSSARSKVGSRRDALIEEVVLDVWIDLEAVFPRRVANLSEEEETRFRTALIALATVAVDASA